MRARVGKEYARQIQPTRNHAPTEYNLQYKRWPQNGADIPKPLSTIITKKKPIKAGRIWSSSKPQKSKQTNGTNADSSGVYVDEASGRKATCGTDSYVDLLSYDGTTTDDAKGYLSSALLTAPVKLHARQETNGVSKSQGTQKEAEYRDGMRPKHYSVESAPPKVKKAWLSSEEEERYQKFLQDDISAKLQCLSHSSVQSMKSTATSSVKSARDEAQKSIGWNSLLSAEASSRPQNPSSSQNEKRGPIPTRRTSFEGFSSKSANQFGSSEWKSPYTEYDDGSSAVPHLKVGGKVITAKSPRTKDKKINLDSGIKENDLRKIYIEASEDELKRLKRNLKNIFGSKQTREQIAKKKNILDDNEMEKHTPTMTKEDFDNLRVAAFRSSQKAVGLHHKAAWETTYGTNFCRDWTKCHSADHVSESEGDTDKSDTEPEVKHHNESKPEKHTYAEKESEDKQDVDKKEEEKKEEIEASPESRTNDKAENVHISKKDLATSKRTPSACEKVLKEADAIEEREYRGQFSGDGKPKMKLDTTYGYTYRGHQSRKPENPVWADKTMVSLASGHWNLLWDLYDGWEKDKKAGTEAKDRVPKNKDGRAKYKIKVYEPNEVCPSRMRRRKEMIMGSYGGGEHQPRKTNVSFMTEYMRKFTRMPLPRKQIRV